MWCRVLVSIVVLPVLLATSKALKVEDETNASINIELLEWDLEAEACPQKHDAQWKMIIKQEGFDADDRVAVLCETAEQTRSVANKTKQYLELDFRNSEMNRRIELLSYPGLTLLPAPVYKQVAEHEIKAELLQRGSMQLLNYSSQQAENITIMEVDGVMANSRNAAKLREVWLAWEKAYKPSDPNSWSNSLEHLNEAAELNEAKSTQEFWEIQSDWPNGYTEANKLWEEIRPMYRIFQGFVRRKLQAHYSDVPDPIPIHLLGSTLGHDWSYIGDIVQPEVYNAIQESLREKGLGGQAAYNKSQEAAVALGLPHLGTDFQSSSVYNVSCPAIVLPSCSDDAVRVFTCGETSWQRYLEAHESVFRAAHHQLAAADNTYIHRHADRVSGLAEAIANLGSLLATLNAVDAGLVTRDGSDPAGQDIELRVLIALRVLPRLPVALASDLCRLRAAPTPDSTKTPAELCWPLRRQMQGVSSGGLYSEEPELWDALGDPHFTTHKPYLSEFAGLLLQFELLERLQKDGKIQNIDEDLRSALIQGYKKPWPALLSDIGISSVSTLPLRRFFQPVMPLFDDMAPLPDLEEALEATTTMLPVTTTTVLVTTPTNVIQEVTEKSTQVSDRIEIDPTLEAPSSGSSSTMFIAIAAVAIGVLLVVASVFLVNRRRKARQVRTRRKIYDPVVAQRHSVGRPTTFSPVVAKRLSENGDPPPPLLTTFKEHA